MLVYRFFIVSLYPICTNRSLQRYLYLMRQRFANVLHNGTQLYTMIYKLGDNI